MVVSWPRCPSQFAGGRGADRPDCDVSWCFHWLLTEQSGGRLLNRRGLPSGQAAAELRSRLRHQLVLTLALD